jgi:Uncharacterized conserved protein
MAIREGDVIVVTTPYIPGYRVVKVIGVALGITVRSRGLGGRFLAGLSHWLVERFKSSRNWLNRLGAGYREDD